MYRSGAQAGPSGSGTINGSGAKVGEKTDDVIDVEYVDTEEKKKE